MKKRLMSKLLITTLLSTMLLSTVPSFATDTISIKIILNGQEISYNQESGYPFIDNSGRTLVPFRQTMEAFGCDVNWNQTEQIATASKNGITVQVPIGQSYILKDSAKVENDTQAVVKNGKTYLPIRVVLQSFGADVEWDNNSKAVVAKSENNVDNNTVTSIVNPTPINPLIPAPIDIPKPPEKVDPHTTVLQKAITIDGKQYVDKEIINSNYIFTIGWLNSQKYYVFGTTWGTGMHNIPAKVQNDVYYISIDDFENCLKFVEKYPLKKGERQNVDLDYAEFVKTL